jgi:peptidoglycan DL-endopeptidase CwlO
LEGHDIRIAHPRLNIRAIAASSAAVTVFFAFSPAVLADQFDNQISALTQQAQAYQKQADSYAEQATTYQAKIAQLNAQISATETQIEINKQQYSFVSNEITANQAKLAVEKSDLGADLKALYLDSTESPLEMLASSGSLSDFFNKEQYQTAIQGKMQAVMSSVVATQEQLANQQGQISDIISSEKEQQAELNASESQASQLLALANQNVAAANAQIASANSQINSLRAQQAAMFASLAGSSSGGNGTTTLTFRNLSFGGQCGGNYPSSLCNPPTDAVVDQWDLYNRECVSYAAWAMTQRGAAVPTFNGEGNATQWPGYLAARGYAVNNNPAGAAVVAIAPASLIGGVGHAMVVDSIESGGWIHVSQYNWWPTENGPYGLYSEMDLKVIPGLEFIHFR